MSKKDKKSYFEVIESLEKKAKNSKVKTDFGFKENPIFDIADNRYPDIARMNNPISSPIYLRHQTVKNDLEIPSEYMGEGLKNYNNVKEAPMDYMEKMRKIQLETAKSPDINTRGAANVNRIDQLFAQQGWGRIPKNAKKGSALADTFSYIKKSGKNVGKIIPGVGLILTGLGAAGYSDLAGAATDAVIPGGGIEELGVADERSIPDPRYQEYIRRMQQRKK